MGHHPYALGAMLALLVAVVVACSGGAHPVAPQGVTNAQGLGPSVLDHGWAVLVEADRQAKDLERLRDGTTDPFMRDEISAQIADLRARSNRLIDDMTIGDGKVHDSSIRADITNLERSASAGANAEKQAEPEVQRAPAR